MTKPNNDPINSVDRNLKTVSIDLDYNNPIHRVLAEIINVVDDDHQGYGTALNRANSLAGLSSRLNMLAVTYLDSQLKHRGEI